MCGSVTVACTYYHYLAFLDGPGIGGKLIEDVQSFSAEKNPLKIELEDFDAFRPKVIFLHVKPNQPLATMRSELESFLVSKDTYPIKAESRPFHPHVTIANRDLLRKDFQEAFGHFKKIAYKQNFIANEIALLKHIGGEWKTAHLFSLRKLN